MKSIKRIRLISASCHRTSNFAKPYNSIKNIINSGQLFRIFPHYRISNPFVLRKKKLIFINLSIAFKIYIFFGEFFDTMRICISPFILFYIAAARKRVWKSLTRR